MTSTHEGVRTADSHQAAMGRVRHLLGRVATYLVVCVATVFFALPLVWLALTPFAKEPNFRASLRGGVTLDNFRELLDNPQTWPSIRNSLILSIATAVVVVALSALASYALSRVRVPGRDQLLYGLLLLSSIVTGTAAMVPIFLMLFQLNMLDSYTGVVLVLTGGLLPAAIFMLKDFVDAIPRSYEESARGYGAKPSQILRHIALPLIRPGMATVGVWALVQVWGNFLVPYVLFTSESKQPAAVAMYTFYDSGGQPNFALISTFALVYSVPVVVLYLLVNRRYGFAFQGGIKG
nr:carbohydrate ABC transporter permease [Nakamurella aerolata]